MQDLFNYIKTLKDPNKLAELKKNLEATNNKTTATELVNTLTTIDHEFEKFSDLIESFSKKDLFNFATIIIALISLALGAAMYIDGKAGHKEIMKIENEQLDVSRERLHYQKETFNLEKEKIEADAKQFAREQERKIKDVAPSLPRKHLQLPARRKKPIKGQQRNKPCPCGSGKKAKKCHPNGF